MSAPPQSTKRPRGLSAVKQSQEDRAQKRYRMTPGAGYVGAAVVILTAIAYKFATDRTINTARERLIAKQQEVVKAVGVDWFVLREKLENEIVDGAKQYRGDYIDPGMATWQYQAQPGIYLRMRVADATTVERVREVAPAVRRDAFAGCLLREPNDALLQGAPDASAFPEQPWNLGQTYSATRVLSDAWTSDVREANDKVRLNVLDQELDAALSEDVPLVSRVVKKAQFFLLVLDEDVRDVTAAAAAADGGAVTEELLQLVPHPSRVYLVDLRTNKEMLRLRLTASAKIMSAGERPSTDPQVQEAAQRQANNCSLAQMVESATTAPSAKP